MKGNLELGQRLIASLIPSLLFGMSWPNLFQSAVVIGTFAMASVIMSEAAPSFLGHRRAPRNPNLYQYIPWLAFAVPGINPLCDGLRACSIHA